MSAADHNFQLYCDAANSRYVLAKEVEAWREIFSAFDDAYLEAETRATEATPLVVYNEIGKVILTTRVAPLLDFVTFRNPLLARKEPLSESRGEHLDLQKDE